MTSVDDARKDVLTKQADLDAADAELTKCGVADQACKDTKQADIAAKRNDPKLFDEALGSAVIKARGAVAAFAESHASTVIAQGVGALQGGGVDQARVEVVNALATVHRKYIENNNADPIIVACLTA